MYEHLNNLHNPCSMINKHFCRLPYLGKLSIFKFRIYDLGQGAGPGITFKRHISRLTRVRGKDGARRYPGIVTVLARFVSVYFSRWLR